MSKNKAVVFFSINKKTYKCVMVRYLLHPQVLIMICVLEIILGFHMLVYLVRQSNDLKKKIKKRL